MNISVITPIYEGEEYVNQLVECVEKATGNFYAGDIELIMVNDSPWQEITYNTMLVKKTKIIIINNKTNLGIHKSRINGLHKAKGDYILFLDQDDIISPQYFNSQCRNLHNGIDMVISNGIREEKSGNRKLYRKERTLKFLLKKSNFINLHNPIISPGQCLIKKDVIPQYWCTNDMNENGADDYFLWLLLLKKNITISYNFECLYTHKFTGSNVSNNLNKMYRSSIEMCNYLTPLYTPKEIKKIKASLKYTDTLLKGNVGEIISASLSHFNLFILNFVFYIFYR